MTAEQIPLWFKVGFLAFCGSCGFLLVALGVKVLLQAFTIGEAHQPGLTAFLSGKKTYILAAVGAGLTIAHALGYLNDQTFYTLLTLTGTGTVATLRAGITKSGPNGIAPKEGL